MADIDVSPGILENMHKAIDASNANKRARNRLIVKAEKGQAGYKDAYEYAGLRGKAAANAIREIEETDLPNGRMYFNIADKSIRPVLEETGDDVFSFASQLLENVNEKAGIHLKPVLPDPEETNEKIKGILDLASSNEHWNEVREETAQTVENFSRKCVDDHIRANAERQYEAGLTGKVVRTASRGACEWCEDVAGSYEYAAVKGRGEDVWRRHANCDCVIEYEPVKGKRQTVSSGGYRQNKDSLSPQERERRTEEHLQTTEGDLLKTTNSNVVQLNALDAPGFREKFDKITTKSEVNESIYHYSVEILKHRTGSDFEDLYLVDGKTGNLIYSLTNSKKRSGIQYNDIINDVIDKAHKEGISIIAIHNHPSGMPPTLDDGSSAFVHGYDLGVVVGHNLEVYRFTPTAYAIPVEVCTDIHNKISNVLAFGIDYEEKAWYSVIGEFGMEVKRL